VIRLSRLRLAGSVSGSIVVDVTPADHNRNVNGGGFTSVPKLLKYNRSN
jgi:hypothetical protein